MVSRKAVGFLATLSRREHATLMLRLDEIAAYPSPKPDDEPRHDNHGRLTHLRFVDGYALILWFDHAERVVNVLDAGRQ